MKEARSQQLLRRFAGSLRRTWIMAVRAVDRGRLPAEQAAGRFADEVIRLSVMAGYAEARHLRTGAFDPTLSAERFRVERGGLVSRFMADVQRAAGRTSVGLSARQARDLRAFAATLERATLDANTFNEAATFSTPESRRQVRRVQSAMLEQRARLIGRTEGLAALSLGVDVAVEQTEAITGQPIKRTWKTAADEKVRSSHSSMSGQTRSVGEPFISGNGVALMRPGDPSAPANERANCRCMLITGG